MRPSIRAMIIMTIFCGSIASASLSKRAASSANEGLIEPTGVGADELMKNQNTASSKRPNVEHAIGIFEKATDKIAETVATYPRIDFTAALATSLVLQAGGLLRQVRTD